MPNLIYRDLFPPSNRSNISENFLDEFNGIFEIDIKAVVPSHQ